MKHIKLATDFRKSFLFYFRDTVSQTEPHYYKIPDAPIHAGIRRIPVYRPYDAYGVALGRFYAFEYKTWNNTRFPFSAVKTHQEEALKHVMHTGGLSFLIFCGEITNNELFILTIDSWLALKTCLWKKGQKSCLKKDFLTPNMILIRAERRKFKNGYGWNLFELRRRYHSG